MDPQFYMDLPTPFEERSWLKFDTLGLVLGMASNFYASVAK